MEYFTITPADSEWHVKGFPEAVKVIRIDGPKAKRLAALSQHNTDLMFAVQCLKTINQVADRFSPLSEALWRSAIVHYIKCFGRHQSRSPLSAKKIYNNGPGALGAFGYFKDLRNKFLIHDDNPYSQSLPGAILNRRNKKYKIEKVTCLSVTAGTLGQANWSNLSQLIEIASSWVSDEFETLCQIVTKELEAVPYDELYAREGITYSPPTADDIKVNRGD